MLTVDGVSAGLLILRLGMGATLFMHGFQKVFLGGRIPGTGRWFDSLGMRPGRIHAYAAASTEMGASVLFAMGLLTPFAAAGMVSVMLVAAWMVNRPNGFFSMNHGWEYNFVIALVAVSVATCSAGKYSLDWAIGHPDLFGGWGGFLIAFLLGVGGGAAHLAVFWRPPAPEPEKA